MMNPGSQGFYNMPHDDGNGVPFTMPVNTGTQHFTPDLQELNAQTGWSALRLNAELFSSQQSHHTIWDSLRSNAEAARAKKRPNFTTAAALLATTLAVSNGTIQAEATACNQNNSQNQTEWIRNLLDDGDIEHQPGPGNRNRPQKASTQWCNENDFPELFRETSFHYTKMPGGLLVSRTGTGAFTRSTRHSTGNRAQMLPR
eukprot:3091504-Heterocapsa_arctica.AAC.1